MLRLKNDEKIFVLYFIQFPGFIVQQLNGTNLLRTGF
jgi:hypothetical protein